MKDISQILKKLKKSAKEGNASVYSGGNRIVVFVIILAAVIFLSSNILASQSVSPLFFGIAANDIESAASYLKKIRNENSFEGEYRIMEETHGKTLEELVYSEEIARDSEINKLERLLSINPNSRDVLYGLFLLYKNKGDEITADRYFKQVREVDPGIK